MSKCNGSWKYDVLDCRWSNFKRWVYHCEDHFGENETLLISKVIDMIRYIDKSHDQIDKVIMKSFLSNEAPNEKSK